MKPKAFCIPYEIVDNLTAGERFVYYEFCRLAATENKIDSDFKIRIPQGALITSHYRMSKILDLPYSITVYSIERLYKKGLIDVRPVEFEDFSSYYMVRVRNYYPIESVAPLRTPMNERIFPF